MSTTSDAPMEKQTAPPPKPSSAVPGPLTLDAEVAGRINEVRQRHRRVALVTGLAMALCALLGWLVFESFFDWLVAFPWLVRALIFVVGAGGTYYLARKIGVDPYRQPIGDEAAALMIEREMPVFRSRFIASVQLFQARESQSSPSLVRALISETASMARERSFEHVVKTEAMKKWLKIAAGAVTAAVLLWFIGGKASAPLLTRALLWNNAVPRKTQISGVPGNRAVAIGDDFRIEATAGGMIPSRGRVLVTTTSGRKQEFSLDPESGSRTHFVRLLQGVQESFDYTVELGDARTDRFHVKVKTRPGVRSIECTQDYPAYTKLTPQKRATGDLKLLVGSRLSVKLTANAPLKSGVLRLVGVDPQKPIRTAPMSPDAQDRSVLNGSFEITKDISGLNLLLVDEDGVESKGGAVYRIEVIPDAPPTVQIRWPDRREELLTPGATMLLAFHARDDFGIAALRLHYAVDWTEDSKDHVIDLDLGGRTPVQVARRFEWKFSKIQPPITEGQVVDYWLEVVDTNTATGPGVTKTEHYQARIVSEIEKRADLANRLNDTMQGLDEVRQGQEDVSKRLGEFIFEKPQ